MRQHAPEDHAIADLPVVAIERLDLRFVPRPWPFAVERRAEIDAHFETLRREKPALFNGRVLIQHRHEIAGAALRGEYLETDFASFIAWRDWDFPDTSMRNCFGLGALRGSDGGFLLGVMGAHTANAGRIYFPGGTPDLSDVFDGAVDLESSVRREVAEETGLTPDAFDIAPGWLAVLAGARIAMIKVMRAREPAATMRARIRRHLAAETQPELSDVHIAHGADDLDPRMPPFVIAFLRYMWEREGRASASHRGNP
jgi:8-oxo-dGTP pyrophosphatase MutT (NUDIX family)